jgi:hypothetical protein
MALLKQSKADQDFAIPRLSDDQAYSAAVSLLEALNERSLRLEREKKRYAFERYFAGRKASPNDPHDVHLRKQLADLRAEPPLHPTPQPPLNAPSDAIAAALKILAGEKLSPVHDQAAQERAIEQQLEIIGTAYAEQSATVEQIRGNLSLEYCKRIAPVWIAEQVDMFRCGQELARKAARVLRLQGEIQLAGVQHRTDILPGGNCALPFKLGSESDYGSVISYWRRSLEQVGILK